MNQFSTKLCGREKRNFRQHLNKVVRQKPAPWEDRLLCHSIASSLDPVKTVDFRVLEEEKMPQGVVGPLHKTETTETNVGKLAKIPSDRHLGSNRLCQLSQQCISNIISLSSCFFSTGSLTHVFVGYCRRSWEDAARTDSSLCALQWCPRKSWVWWAARC